MISLRMLPALKIKNASKNMTERFSPSLTPERFFNKELMLFILHTWLLPTHHCPN